MQAIADGIWKAIEKHSSARELAGVPRPDAGRALRCAGSAAHLERDRERRLEDSDPRPRLVVAGGLAEPDLGDDGHRGRHADCSPCASTATRGKIVHDVKVFDVEKPEHIAAVNSYASPTPAIEAGRVYVHYGTYGTACLDTASGQDPLDAARSELRPPRGPRLVADPLRQPVDRPRGRPRRAIRHRAGQGDRQDRLEDQPLDRLQPVPGQHAQGVLHADRDRHRHAQGTHQSRGEGHHGLRSRRRARSCGRSATTAGRWCRGRCSATGWCSS